MPFAAPVPILRSFDEAATRAFYCDFLDFVVEFEHRFDPGGPLYMGLRRGDCVLHVSEHHGDGVPGIRLRIAVSDAAALATALRAKGYRHARPGDPQMMPWGTLDFTVDDPNGNKLTFTSGGDG